MIEELRILTNGGLSIFNGTFSNEDREFSINTEQENVLFAGFISAILSMFSEVRRAPIDQINFLSNKLMIMTSGQLVFVMSVKQSVPNKEANIILKLIVNKINDFFNDKTSYEFVSDKQREGIVNIVQNILLEELWWVDPKFNLKNSLLFTKTAIVRPSGTYFVNYLPSKFGIISLLLFIIPNFVAYAFGTNIIGFGTQKAYTPDALQNLLVLCILWLLPGLIIKATGRRNYKLSSYLLLSGVYLVIISFMVFFGSFYYKEFVVSKLLTNYIIAEGYRDLVLFMLIRLPINVSFFFYLILSAYGSSFAANFPTSRYYFLYLIAILISISITEALSLI